MDALLLSATLLNILAFALPQSETISSSGSGSGTGSKSDESDLSSSWVFSSRSDRLDWLALQTGIKSLLTSTTTYLEKTMTFLGPIFLGEERESWAFGGHPHALKDVPERWIQVFGLESSSPSSSLSSSSSSNDDNTSDCAIAGVSIYRPAVIVLAKLRHLLPTPANVFKNLQFLAKVQREFCALLYVRDERALWLFGYWLGLMRRFRCGDKDGEMRGTWWCERRVRRDYEAVCLWLRGLRLGERSGREGELWRGMMRELEMAPLIRVAGSSSGID